MGEADTVSLRMYTEIRQCRICGNTKLITLLDLGEQALTGVFPASVDQKVEKTPVELVKCTGEGNCGLVQLKHTVDPEEMYGENYGYRSDLNPLMVEHLKEIAEEITQSVPLNDDDRVLDIGSNDATLLKFFDTSSQRIGMDPTGEKFRDCYGKDIQLIPDFFSAESFLRAFDGEKAKVVTSIAMFYDLPEPQKFVDDIAAVLDDEGVWVFEQSYLPSMIKATAYDTICQEHLEYYAMKQIVWLLERADMCVLQASLNDANGGSIRVTAAKSHHPSAPSTVAQEYLEREKAAGLDDLPLYEGFRQRVFDHRDALVLLLGHLKSEGKTVFGLGASTKGNVLLQFCELTEEDLPCIAEVNKYKFGRFTPGTHIPIVSQAEADARNPDAYLVLPWHFREGIQGGMSAFLERGGQLIFPLPTVDIVKGSLSAS